jgi:O-antigen ligase
MKATLKFVSVGLKSRMLIMAGILLIPVAAFWIAFRGIEQAILLGQVLLFAGSVIAILRQPYLGVVVAVASLPLVEILPSIPYSTSAVSLLGGVTLGSYLLRQSRKRKEMRIQHKGLVLGVFFVIWLSLSNPFASFLPSLDGRNWFFTFLQLLLLAWLAARTLDTPRKQCVLMWVFSIATVFSAIYALQQGYIGETVRESVRSEGLAAGANSAARYFVVSLILMYYIRNTVKGGLLRLFLVLGMAGVILGALYTVSRTGLLLLVAALGMLLLQLLGRRRQLKLLVLLMLVIVLTWSFADNVLSIFRSIFPSIREGTDTIGLRYALWQAGWRMWLEQPIRGVGIGQYIEQLAHYGGDLLPTYHLRLGAHNMYIQVLAETGLVGLILFLSIFVVAVRSLWIMTRSDDVSKSSLAQTWLIVLVLMLLGGITKHDHYDKLVWAIVGISASPVWLGRYSENHVQD